MYLRRRPAPACPACASPHGARHAASCRLLRVARQWRHPTDYVTATDTVTLACGCAPLLVRQFGGWGHRVDHSEPDAPRPPAFHRDELTVGAALIIVSTGCGISAAAGDGDPRSRAVAVMLAATVLLAILSLTMLRLSRRPTSWPGRKTYRAGEPGRYVPCTWCAGDGVEFAPAYPNPVGPAHTTTPNT